MHRLGHLVALRKVSYNISSVWSQLQLCSILPMGDTIAFTSICLASSLEGIKSSGLSIGLDRSVHGGSGNRSGMGLIAFKQRVFISGNRSNRTKFCLEVGLERLGFRSVTPLLSHSPVPLVFPRSSTGIEGILLCPGFAAGRKVRISNAEECRICVGLRRRTGYCFSCTCGKAKNRRNFDFPRLSRATATAMSSSQSFFGFLAAI